MYKKFPLNFSELLALMGVASAVFAILREFDFARDYSLYLSIGVVFVTGCTFCVLRIWEATKVSDEWKFKIIPLSSGDDALKNILDTSKSIIVTHFTEDEPTKAYIDLMLRKLGEGVWVTRYLPEDFDNNHDKNKWINDFSNHNNYVEKNVNGHQMPFDIAIFDSSKVVLSFATNRDIRRFNKAIEMSNKEVVDFFKVSLEKLEVVEHKNGLIRPANQSLNPTA